ncbi:hypothetical protein GDO81_004787 [Engystomops pustulosus]|uniref:Uncharacterized protein n=1 Tax=Engystomops pustulosus TaxID=76066 RepID=A0AAV7CIH8_ENGPU|nr:hypothetical protein GDO81_004787 [Engystomops pustulosus]
MSTMNLIARKEGDRSRFRTYILSKVLLSVTLRKSTLRNLPYEHVLANSRGYLFHINGGDLSCTTFRVQPSPSGQITFKTDLLSHQ